MRAYWSTSGVTSKKPPERTFAHLPEHENPADVFGGRSAGWARVSTAHVRAMLTGSIVSALPAVGWGA